MWWPRLDVNQTCTAFARCDHGDHLRLHAPPPPPPFQDRGVKMAVRSAFATGRPSGVAGDLNLSTIDVSALDSAVSAAHLLSNLTPEAERLVWGAQVLRLLRAALRHGEEKTAEEALHELETCSMRDEVDAEIRLVSAELANRQALGSLMAALSQGWATGAVGSLDVSTIEHHPLQLAVELADAKRLTHPSTLRLLATGRIVLDLRDGLRHSNWRKVESAISRAAVGGVESTWAWHAECGTLSTAR